MCLNMWNIRQTNVGDCGSIDQSLMLLGTPLLIHGVCPIKSHVCYQWRAMIDNICQVVVRTGQMLQLSLA